MALLVVFVTGGVLTPFLHRAHHGYLSARQYVDAPEACDHKRHGDSFEGFLSDIVDDSCLLCVRLLQFDAPQTILHANRDFTAFRTSLLLNVEASHIFFASIRGPPDNA